MDCRTFQKNLEDYLEGGMDFAGRFGMERHAGQCFACGKVLADAHQLSRMARELTRVTAPPDLESRVLARIQTRELTRRSRSLWRFWVFGFEWPAWRPFAVASLALVLAALGTFYTVRWALTGSPGDAPLAMDRTVPAVEPGQREGGRDLTSSASVSPNAGGDAAGEAFSAAGDPSFRSNIGYATEQELPAIDGQPTDSDYVEYLVPGPGDRQLIMRLPKTIRMRYGQPSEEYFIRNVSH